MRIAVLGAGAMGSLFGGLLAQAGEDVTLVDVWEDHIKAIKEHGLTMICDGVEENVKINAETSPAQVGPVDLVIFLVKGTHTEQAIKNATPMIQPDTRVLTLQNGLGNAEKIADVVGEDKVLFGVIDFASVLLGPGRISSELAKRTIHFKPLNNIVDDKVKQVEQVFRNARINAEISLEVERDIWRKLVINCNLNALCTVCRIRTGTLLDQGEITQSLFKDITKEIVTVAGAKGINLDFEECMDFLNDLSSKVRGHYPSMTQDLMKKRKTEIEFINGAVVREGKKHGVATPVNETLYHLITILHNTYSDQF
ncbi:ketopantoate reductase family protein [Gelria sp. Kuro-4]|uniref:ketopantoate reductase family protein n=1 Tax=Gelria sp. Kuro-4 TaxID=2796927 RepID=UPI001BEDDAB6|nr:2-dehydropantoate 2-reductase [Gelria sp. Kuro-4]BCV23478.1 hypothetical protein kuro4_02510 [Gelria sp. Kuro-4]